MAMGTRTMKSLGMAAALVVLIGCGGGPGTPGKGTETNVPLGDRSLSIAWAVWPPSDVLKKMAEEWAKANNVKVTFHLYPWAEYQGKVYDTFTKKAATYDIIIGDSQWLGKGAVEGQYLELTDWLKKESHVEDFEPAALRTFCEYPPGSGQYYAAPCLVDACGWSYRKDLFEDPKEKEAFQAKYKRELAVPKTWQELRDIAEFFTRPDQKLCGLAVFTDDGQYDAITMGFQQVMWAWGGSYCDNEFKVEGVLNSKAGVEALQFYKDLLKFAPPEAIHNYHPQCLKAFMGGEVAMAMNYFALMPPLVDPKQNKLADKTGFFAMPAGPSGKAFVSLGGQGFSICQHSKPQKQALAKQFIKWFLQDENQKRWALNPGCFSAHRKVISDPAVRNAAPFNAAFIDSLPLLRDFYCIPEHSELLASCQKHWHAALAGKETPQEAMDAVAKEHTEILKKAGALK
jgi:multiple sugar transport system substrate-binding protein